jgi:hypothetical protein
MAAQSGFHGSTILNSPCWSLNVTSRLLYTDVLDEKPDNPDGPLDAALPIPADAVVLVELESFHEGDVTGWDLGGCGFG